MGVLTYNGHGNRHAVRLLASWSVRLGIQITIGKLLSTTLGPSRRRRRLIFLHLAETASRSAAVDCTTRHQDDPSQNPSCITEGFGRQVVLDCRQASLRTRRLANAEPK